MLLRFIVFCAILVVVNCVTTKNEDDFAVSSKDSYLSAYAVTKKLNKKADINGYYPSDIHPIYDDNGFDQPYYGPPKPVYGPPKPVYGPSAPYQPSNYGPYPPAPPPNYGPPQPFIPYSLIGGILDKIKYKIDLLTIGKIILKLIIFKKIVSWLAIICLLLFLPSLKKKHFNNNNNGGDEDELLRSFNSAQNDVGRRLDNVGKFVVESINSFSRKQNDTKCDSIYCKSQKLRDYIDDKVTYERLVNLYSREL